MIEVDRDNVLGYLRRTGHLEPGRSAAVEPLGWGVSNIVLRISPAGGGDFVVKQSRRQLRTEAEWFSNLDRIYREADVMKALAPLLPSGVIPPVLFEDRENYLFGMEAAPVNHVVWKAELLQGHVETGIASALGDYLAAIHRETAGDVRLQELLGDRRVFDQLRVDPFYRHVVEAHPDLAAPIGRLIDEMYGISACAVHADFSPKNVLVTRAADDGVRATTSETPKSESVDQIAQKGAMGTQREFRVPRSEFRAADGGLQTPDFRITLVDFETGHFGEPAFDLGFFLSHLMLKSVLHGERRDEFLNLATMFWNRYLLGLETLRDTEAFAENTLERRAVLHLAACMLARIDGKSTIDYLPAAGRRDFVRRFSRQLCLDPPDRLSDAFARLGEQLVEVL